MPNNTSQLLLGSCKLAVQPANGGQFLGADCVLSIGPTSGGAEHEVPPTTVTSTGWSNFTYNEIGSCVGATLVITAMSGTNPTFDLKIQASKDGGVNWQDVYHFERQTGTGGGFGGGVAIMPLLPVDGVRRWWWTIGGTGTSVTFNVATCGCGTRSEIYRQYFDRTPALLNGTPFAISNTYDISGCAMVGMAITIGAATTPASYQMQMSVDGVNFWFVGNVTAVTNSTVVFNAPNGFFGHWLRVACSGAGTAQTGVVVAVMATD